MKRPFPRPRIFASRCLGFAACRWNGEIIPDKFVEKLRSYADFVTACPEYDIGLGTPRKTVRIVLKKGSLKLIQPDTGRDLTKNMKRFTTKFLDSIGKVDAFILQDHSPSCGIRGVKIYPDVNSPKPVKKGAGFFGAEVLRRFAPEAAIETERSLARPAVKRRFLKKILSISRCSGISSPRGRSKSSK